MNFAASILWSHGYAIDAHQFATVPTGSAPRSDGWLSEPVFPLIHVIVSWLIFVIMQASVAGMLRFRPI